MKLSALRPILRTHQIAETVEFYTEILGFNLDNYDEEWGWASLSLDGVEIMLATPNEHEPFDKPTFTGSFYFNTDNVDEWWEQLKDKARICYELETFEYGMREFAVYDNNGYLLQFGQEV
ncbi:MAG TPA: VOC family protein [Emticicia sp.]